MRTKVDFLKELRPCLTAKTLKDKTEQVEKTLTGVELLNFLSAADHCRAEILTGCLYKKVPSEVWEKLSRAQID